MKKTVLILFALLIVFGAIHRASAHTFVTDGDITVLLHTNPDDDPIVNQPAALLFEITDSANKFTYDNCNCTLTIANGDKVLYSGGLLQVVGASVYGLTEPFTFPSRAVYQITLTGEPKLAGSFQNFQAKYNLRVDRGTAASQPAPDQPKIYLILAGVLIFAIIIGVVVYFRRDKRK